MPLIADRLRQINLKLERAKKHFSDLNREANSFLQSNPYSVSAKHDPNTRRLVYYISKASPIPDSLTLIAGDAVQNLATCLDHLAYQIVCSDTNDSPPNPSRIYFPIADSFEKYQAKKHGKMEGASIESLDAIDALKPYKGGNELLWAIHQLNNVEKHRLLLTIGSVSGMEFSRVLARSLREVDFPADLIETIPFFVTEQTTGALKEGHEIYIGKVDEQPDVNQKFTIGISLCEPEIIEQKLLIETLQQLILLVENIIVALTPQLKDTV